MLEYLIALLLFLYLYRGIRFYIIRKRDFSKQKIIKGAEPFLVKRGSIGVLCVHGYTSSAYDYIELAKYLARKNITTKAVLLDGHGTSPDHLLNKTDADWKRSIRKGMRELRRHAEKVYICGDSMGGNLAIWYASRHKVDGIISIGTPILIKRERLYKVLYPILKHFKIYQKKWYHTIHLPKEIVKKRKTYSVIPLKSTFYAAKVIRESKRLLGRVKAPILIMQSTTDWGVGAGSVDHIYRKVSSRIKQVVWLENMYHVLIVDPKRMQAFRHIYSFIRQTSCAAC